MMRVSLSAGADSAKVANAVQTVLSENGRPTRLRGSRAVQAIENETWRGIDQIGELSAIEFRTLLVRGLADFAKDEKLSLETTGKLTKLAQDEWGRVLANMDVTIPPHRADWQGQCGKLADSVVGKAKELLTAEQFEHLKAAVASRLGK
jgi:hypothetical protein